MVILRITWDACLKMQTTIGSAVYWNLRFKAQCFHVWLSPWCFSGNVHCFSPNIEHSHSKIKNTAKGILIPLQVFNNGLRIYPDSKIFTDSSQAQAWTFRVHKVNYSGNLQEQVRTSSVVRIPSASLAKSCCHILSVYSWPCLLLRVSHSCN